MRSLVLVTVLTLSALASAETRVYLKEADSRALYDALDVRIVNGKSGWAKIYRSGDGQAEIYCTKSKIPPPAIQYACTFTFQK